MATGIYNIPQGSVDITIPYGFGVAPTAVFCSVFNTSDDAAKLAISAIVTGITASAFTVHLSGAENGGTPTANYTLAWFSISSDSSNNPSTPSSGSINLIRYAIPAQQAGAHQHVWPLKIIAISSKPGIPNEIFVYRVSSNGLPDRADAVASVPALSLYGLQPQSVGPDAIPFYRKSVYEHDCFSAAEMEELWGYIQDDVQDLLDNFNAKAAMVISETVGLS